MRNVYVNFLHEYAPSTRHSSLDFLELINTPKSLTDIHLRNNNDTVILKLESHIFIFMNVYFIVSSVKNQFVIGDTIPTEILKHIILTTFMMLS